MSETIRIIEAIGQQWPFLVVVFVIVTIIINRKHIGDYVSNISTIRLKKGENEISFDRKPTGYTKEKGLTPHDESNSTNRKSDIRLLSKSEASLMLFKKLEDPSVSNIKIITYTNEVEAGQINQYKVKGNKTIEIYKRSVIADLYEQQKANIDRLIKYDEFRPWRKNRVIVEATARVEQAFIDNPHVTVRHFFYDNPPTKRAYIFDDKEAIYSYYECFGSEKNGSIYKGMGDLGRLWISTESLIGNYLIKELLNDVNLIKSHSRTLEHEKWLLNNHYNTIHSSLDTPVLDLKAVFLDMDGVLYDSLWQYKIAWKEAFSLKSIQISDKDVYLHEGRAGSETVRFLYNQYLNRDPDELEITEIKDKRNQILSELKKPSPQDGINELLERITKSNLDIFVVTGSSRRGLREDIARDFNGLIKDENIISGFDVKIGKPNPEPYFIALHRAGLKPSEIVVVENAPLGIESSKSAGIYTIAVNTGLLHNEILAISGADNIFENCTQLSDHWIELYNILKAS